MDQCGRGSRPTPSIPASSGLELSSLVSSIASESVSQRPQEDAAQLRPQSRPGGQATSKGSSGIATTTAATNPTGRGARPRAGRGSAADGSGRAGRPPPMRPSACGPRPSRTSPWPAPRWEWRRRARSSATISSRSAVCSRACRASGSHRNTEWNASAAARDRWWRPAMWACSCSSTAASCSGDSSRTAASLSTIRGLRPGRQ